MVANSVGIKSFSITRLKPRQTARVGYQCEFRWNQKFLDYEIETEVKGIVWARLYVNAYSWNQKFLDYEIETGIITNL